jgi:hypothetical protein
MPQQVGEKVRNTIPRKRSPSISQRSGHGLYSKGQKSARQSSEHRRLIGITLSPLGTLPSGPSRRRRCNNDILDQLFSSLRYVESPDELVETLLISLMGNGLVAQVSDQEFEQGLHLRCVSGFDGCRFGARFRVGHHFLLPWYRQRIAGGCEAAGLRACELAELEVRHRQ